MGCIQTQPGLEFLGKECKPARNQQDANAGLPRAADQLLGTGIELQFLFVDCLQYFGGQSFQVSDTPSQAFGKIIDFPAHGGFGDCSHLFFYAAEGGDLIDTFDVDQR